MIVAIHPSFKNHKTKTAPNTLPFGEAARNLVLHTYKSNARARGYEFSLSLSQFVDLTSRDCYYCGLPPSSKKTHKELNGYYVYSGIDRVDNSRGYVIDNVVTCCEICNKAKRNLTVPEFVNWIHRLVQNQVDKGNLILEFTNVLPEDK